MKTILWATLTANGNYARSHVQPPKPETLADFADHVRQVGNFIVGRRTFEGFAAGGPNSPNPFGGIDIVVVSSQPLPLPAVAPDPQAALALLEAKGHQTALVSGGETLHNAFLAAGLVDELVLNIAPVLEDRGLNILLSEGDYRELRLLEQRPLGSGVIQLRYALAR